MDTVFQKRDVIISDSGIAIAGEVFPASQLYRVNVVKDGLEMKSALGGGACLIAGCYVAFSLAWTVLGWILIIAGVLLLALYLPAVINGKVQTYVFIKFVTDGDIRNPVSKMVSVSSYHDAVELQNELKSAGN